MTKSEIMQEIKDLSLEDITAIEEEIQRLKKTKYNIEIKAVDKEKAKTVKVGYGQSDNFKEMESLQYDTMKELWENEHDEIWDKA